MWQILTQKKYRACKFSTQKNTSDPPSCILRVPPLGVKCSYHFARFCRILVWPVKMTLLTSVIKKNDNQSHQQFLGDNFVLGWLSWVFASTKLCCSIKYPYPSHGRFFGLNPPTPLEFPLKPHTFLLKFWLLRPPTPSEFPLTFHGVGMDIFWNCTLQLVVVSCLS